MPGKPDPAQVSIRNREPGQHPLASEEAAAGRKEQGAQSRPLQFTTSYRCLNSSRQLKRTTASPGTAVTQPAAPASGTGRKSDTTGASGRGLTFTSGDAWLSLFQQDLGNTKPRTTNLDRLPVHVLHRRGGYSRPGGGQAPPAPRRPGAACAAAEARDRKSVV